MPLQRTIKPKDSLFKLSKKLDNSSFDTDLAVSMPQEVNTSSASW